MGSHRVGHDGSDLAAAAAAATGSLQKDLDTSLGGTSFTSFILNPYNHPGRLCVYGIYKRSLSTLTKENALVVIAVDIGGKNTQE